MKKIIKNEYNINESDLSKEVTRIKALIINSNNEILLGHTDCYQFIGGHLEGNEKLTTCLKREVLEEVGIEIDTKNIKPFLLLEHYCYDAPIVDQKVNCKMYYFLIKTDQKPDINKTSYTEEEMIGNFKLEYIKLEDFVDVITSEFHLSEKNRIIGEEMIEAYKVLMNDEYK